LKGTARARGTDIVCSWLCCSRSWQITTFIVDAYNVRPQIIQCHVECSIDSNCLLKREENICILSIAIDKFSKATSAILIIAVDRQAMSDLMITFNGYLELLWGLLVPAKQSFPHNVYKELFAFKRFKRQFTTGSSFLQIILFYFYL
jgi:hypothetical protein